MKDIKDYAPGERDQVTAEIVERHANALLLELNVNNIEAIGIAGGIIMNGLGSRGTGSSCHTFYVVDPTVVPMGKAKLNGDEFIVDVAQTMLRGAAS